MTSEIAIIGMVGRFPGASSVEALWENLCQGKEAVRKLTDAELILGQVDPTVFTDPDYVRQVAFLDDVELFDTAFFAISPREAEIMDPQHRLFLECSWQALEAAGYAGHYGCGAVGVYAGCTMNTYLPCNILRNPTAIESTDVYQLNLGNSADFLATRVSYKLGLEGPSHTIQCACSTSLVAVHHACQSLLRGDCEMALAGGVSVNLKHRHGYKYIQGGIISPDGHCRPFDQYANGTIFASGVGIVVLKRLDAALRDRDLVHAVIKGSAINNDGSFKIGYTAPSIEGQAKVIIEALANAGVDPATIGYIEAHGTGTSLGDPVEIQALARAFGDVRVARNSCAIGSVKGNLGHLDAAAGVTGLIKAILVLKNGLIPPTLHFTKPNPEMAIEESPFYINTDLKRWDRIDYPRRAGVSSFGVGGTNAHIVLEEFTPVQRQVNRRSNWVLLTASARTGTALKRTCSELGKYLRQREGMVGLEDVAYTLHVGRKTFSHRVFAICRTIQEAIDILTDPDGEGMNMARELRQDRPTALLFAGDASNYVAAGSALYQELETFREEVERSAELLIRELGWDFRKASSATDGTGDPFLNNLPGVAQFVTEYALARQWFAWGVTPTAMLGYGVGEYVAATLAGVFSLEEGLGLAAVRDRLLQTLPPGKMLTVGLGETEAESLCRCGVWLAAVNGPSQCVLSGHSEALESLAEELQESGIACRWMRSSRALYSGILDPILQPFGEHVSKLKLNAPQLPLLSNVTGTWMTAQEARDPRYWVRHLRGTVRFVDCARELLQDSRRVLLEIGPGQNIARLVRQQRPIGKPLDLFSCLPTPEANCGALLGVLGRLWLSGAAIDWIAFNSRSMPGRVPLPTYPFERQRYWIEPTLNAADVRKSGARSESLLENPCVAEQKHIEETVVAELAPLHERPSLSTPYVPPSNRVEGQIVSIFQKVLSLSPIGVDDNFFDLGGDSFIALQAITEMRNAFRMDIPVVTLYEHLNIRSLAASLSSKRP